MKAKSRLKSAPAAEPTAHHSKPEPASPTHHQAKHTPLSHSSEVKTNRYFKHLPTLLLSLPFYAAVYYLMTRIQPDQIKNLVLPNAFLPFQVLLLIANFFLFSFVFLNSRRGFLAALLFELIVFFRLTSLQYSWTLLAGLIAIFVIIEVLVTGLRKLVGDSAPPEPSPRVARKRS